MDMPANSRNRERGSKSTLEVVQDALPFILFAAIGGVISIINPRFLAWENLSNILLQYSGTAFVALGAMMVLISGGIDFPRRRSWRLALRWEAFGTSRATTAPFC